MALDLRQPIGRPTMGFYALLIVFAALAAGACGGAPALPSRPAVQVPQEPEEQAWNPFVVIEPDGRIFMTYYGGRGGNEYRLLFTRSLDQGLTWLAEPIQLEKPPLPRTRLGFHRVETNKAGRVSVTWSIERREETVWRVRELRHRQSSDFGMTWTGEVLQWPFDKQSNYPSPVTGPNGDLYLLITEGATGKSVPRFIRITGPKMSRAPGPLTLPGADGAAREKPGEPRIREADWPVLTIEPRGSLYAVWQETRAVGSEILFNRSQDGGATWLPSSLLLSRPTSLGNYTGRIPVVAIDGAGGIYVVWEDFRHSTTDLYFNRSLDGGANWLGQDVWLTAVRPPQAAAASPTLSADQSGHLYLLWSDIREVPNSLFFTRSLDQGATWLLQPIRVEHHGPEALTYAHRLAHDDAGHVYVAWWEGTGPTKGSVRFNRSDDYGATWLEKEQILDSGQGKEGPRFPWLSADGQNGVYVVWSSDRSGRYQLYLNRSRDHGKTWLPKDIQITGNRDRKKAAS